MRCWRSFFKRNFCRYLDGELDPPSVARFEDHLLNCGACRGLLARLRNGHRLAKQIPLPAPATDQWEAIEAALESKQVRPRSSSSFRGFADYGLPEADSRPLICAHGRLCLSAEFGKDMDISACRRHSADALAHGNVSVLLSACIPLAAKKGTDGGVKQGRRRECRFGEVSRRSLDRLREHHRQESPFARMGY